MSSQCLGRENTILVSRGFSRSTSTVNLARMICGLLFVLRFVTPSKRSNLRTDIRSKVIKLLDRRSIRHSSVDLVRFRWVEDEGNKENEDDEDDGGDRDDGDTRDDCQGGLSGHLVVNGQMYATRHTDYNVGTDQGPREPRVCRRTLTSLG